MLLASVGRWSASALKPDHHPTLASNAVMKPSLLRGWFRLSSYVGKQHGNDGLCFAMRGNYTKPSTEAKYRLANSDWCFHSAKCYSANCLMAMDSLRVVVY